MKYLMVIAGLFAVGMASHYDMGPAQSFVPEPYQDASVISFSNGIVFDTRQGEPVLPEGYRSEPKAPSDLVYCIVQFRGPIRQDWLRNMEQHGARPLGYLPNYAVLAKMDEVTRGLVAAMPMVRWVGLFQPAYKVAGDLFYAQGAKELVIQVFPDEDANQVSETVKALGAKVEYVMVTDYMKTIKITADVSLLPEIVRLNDVLWIQEWTEPTAANDNCQWVVQSGWRASAPPPTDTASRRPWKRGVRGQGVVLSTTDTGINTGHNMFRDPALAITPPGIWPTHRKLVAYKKYATADAVEGQYHGSHVNGTVAGDDSVTGGTSNYDGMSIKGRLYFVDLTLGTGFVVTTDLTTMYDTIYNGNGLPYRILQQSGSWRWSSTGTYLLQESSSDAFVWRRKNFLNIFAAGNEGGPSRIGNPSAAKNMVTVGASGNGTVSNTLAGFSSRGPTQDNRIKPNICAPGDLIYSATSTGTNTYASMSGTSMATPAINGAMGLLRCYLERGYYPTGDSVVGNRLSYISAALLRSMAYASADPNIGAFVIPSFDIGWGRINIDSVLYFTGDTRRLMLKDDTVGVATGLFKEDSFRVTAAIPLRIAMAYTDSAGAPNANPCLVNNLHLLVTAPGGTFYRGNQYTAGQSTANPGTWDDRNVEECARINAPATGIWTIRVIGQNVRTARQPFAYTISGAVTLLGVEDERPSGIPTVFGVKVASAIFSRATRINLSLPARSNVTLTIYDIDGREVSTLAAKSFEPGNHVFTWSGTDHNGKRVASGVYFYKVETASDKAVGKLILVR